MISPNVDHPVPVTPHRGGMHRILRSAAVALATLSLITCAEDPVGPAGGRGILRVVPVFDANARFSPLLLDQVRVIVERPQPATETSDTVADVTRSFDRGKDQITIDDISIRMQQQSEDLLVTIQLLSGSILLFEGSQTVNVVRGQRTRSTSIPVTYQGPGGNVASLVLAPRDTILSPGATFDYRLDAFDIQGAPVAQYYVHWSLVGGPGAGASIDAAGRLTAPAVRDTFYVKVVSLPTNIDDSTRVIIAPSATPTVTPVPLASGDDQSCQIKAGVTYCWGANDLGQLGDGTTTDRLVPTPVAGGHTFVAVSIGVTHACALTGTGQAFCWGDNSTGALGDGTTTTQTAPVAVGGGFSFAEIAAANGFTCAVTLQGQGRCWGANFEGQLGDGTNTSSTTPVAVAGGHSFVRISAAGVFDGSSDHGCAIDNTGKAWCWGANNEGQLGDGSLTASLVPVAVTGGLSFSDISVGAESSCAITTTGVGVCWGFNFGEQLTSPQPVAGGFTYTALDMGSDHVCGLTATGWVCGGRNNAGQLGDGTTTDRSTPVPPSGGRTFTVIAAGDFHTCGITATATFCWGDNATGQLGTGDATLTDHLTPALVVGAPGSVTVSAGNTQTGPAGGALPIRPAVLVRDAQGNPVPGAEVIFTVTSGGGSLLGGGPNESVLTDAAGVATVSGWILGATAGANGLGARVSAAGVTGNPVGFTATGTTGGTATFTWTGAVSTDWSAAGNWNPAGIPGALDSVVIGAAARQPSLSAPTVVGAVNIIAGGNLVINGQGLATVRGLTTGGTGVLTMTNAADAVSVGGNAVFAGGSELNLLTAGGISLVGNLTQLAGTSGDSYHPSGTHLTVFAGASPQVSFATPGLVPGTSHFQELAWVGTGTLTLLSPVMAHGTLVVSSATSSTIASSNGSRLTVGDLAAVAPVVFSGVPLTISQTTPGSLTLSNITFQGMPNNVSQLVVSSPGAGGVFDFTNLVFNTTPVAPNGFYLEAVDTTGAVDGVLTIDMISPTPPSGGAFVKLRNGAVVNWPVSGARTWLGNTSNLWSVAANWSPAQVPGPTDDVVFPAGTPNSPSLDVNTSIRSLTVNTGGFFNLNGLTLGVTGSVTANGQVSGGVTNSLLTLSGTGQVQGQIETNTTISGAYILGSTLNFGQNSNASFTLGVSGSLDLAGHTANVKGGFSTTGSGVLQMLLPTDSLVVTNGPSLQGRAIFAGGSTAGRLTAGTLSVSGQFTQSGAGASFAPSGAHRTVLNAQVNFADPVNSGFQDVDITGGVGFTAQSAVTIKGTLTAGTNPSGTSSIGGQFGPQVVTTAGVDVSALTMNGATIVVGSGPITRFDNVQFSNSPTTVAQLTVNHPGAATPFVFNNLQFNTTPAAPNGFYLRANDTDGGTPNVLTINMVGASPTTPGAFLNLLGGAVVNWPPVTPINNWTGTAGTAWSTAGNWSLGVVPGATDSVVIPAATNQPVLTASASVGAVTVSGGTLSLNSQTLTVARTFATTGSGTLTSNTAASLLVVAGNALFGGGDETGRLTDGNLRVAGNFTQGVTANSFVATNLHTTFFNGTGAQAVTIPNGGAASSRFQNLRVANGTGVVTVSGTTPLLVVNGTLTVATGGTLTGATAVTAANVTTSTGSTLSVFQLTVPASGLTVAGNYGVDRTILTGGGTVPAITYNNLILTGATAYTLAANASTAASLELQSELIVSGHTLTVGRDFSTTGAGALTMTNAADLVTVAGSTSFSGGDETNKLAAGILRTSNQFLQDAITSPASFVASGTHTVEIISQNPAGGVVNLGTPAVSHFQNLRVLFLSNFASDVVVNGNMEVNFNAAANFFAKRVTVGGTFSQSGIGFFGPTRLRLLGGNAVTGGTLGPDTLEFAGTAPQAYPNVNFSFPKTVLVANDVTAATGVANIANDLEIQSNGIFRLGTAGNTFNVGGALRTIGSGLLQMIDPLATLTVTGNATFAGGSESGLLTDGKLRVSGNFTQSAVTSVTSFAPSGRHQTILGAATARAISMGSPGAGGNGSHFQVLDVSNATGGLSLDVNMQADSLLSNSAAAKLTSPGVALTVRRADVSGLILDNTRFILDEQTTFSPENFSNVTFTGFPVPTTGTTMLTVLGPGGAAAARPVPKTDNVTFQSMAVGAGNFYVSLTSTNGFTFNMVMNGSNQSPSLGGNGPQLTQALPGPPVSTVSWP